MHTIFVVNETFKLPTSVINSSKMKKKHKKYYEIIFLGEKHLNILKAFTRITIE